MVLVVGVALGVGPGPGVGLEPGGAVPAWAAPPAPRRPNVIFILTDDQGWGDAGFAGHPFVRTPHLDRLAREGTWFRHFYVAATVCSPSRTAFMTGQYPARHRIHGHFATAESNAARSMPDWLDPDVTTLPGLLRRAGYATAHFGKWHLGAGVAAPPPERYGIDVSGRSWCRSGRRSRWPRG
ncbi:MAG: hypothetical protein EBR86_16085 [Planctomycetia bacterium]|nr:hypothetical protein [Planctomycetia bacterium]